MKLNIKNMICGLGLMVLATSCDNFLDVHPKGEIVGKDLLSERKGFENALYGVYASMRNDKAYGAYMTYYVMDVLAQYFNCPGNSDITDLSAFKYKENPEVTKVFSDIWSTMYQSMPTIFWLIWKTNLPRPLNFTTSIKGRP